MVSLSLDLSLAKVSLLAQSRGDYSKFRHSDSSKKAELGSGFYRVGGRFDQASSSERSSWRTQAVSGTDFLQVTGLSGPTTACVRLSLAAVARKAHEQQLVACIARVLALAA